MSTLKVFPVKTRETSRASVPGVPEVSISWGIVAAEFHRRLSEAVRTADHGQF